MNRINILVPDLPESVNDAVVVKWYKKIGEQISSEDNIVDIETDKVMLEVSAPCNGILNEILEKEGSIVKSNQILGNIVESKNIESKTKSKLEKSNKYFIKDKNFNISFKEKIYNFPPSIRRIIRIKKNKEIFNELNYIKNQENIIEEKLNDQSFSNEKEKKIYENRIKMTRLRQKIAERLLETKNNTAMLTTFNEVNMQPIISLRKKYGEFFEKKHGVRIGFMPFFVKAVVESLKKFPEINASIDKNDIVYYKNIDVSIAVSTPRGVITPVLRNADNMSMADIEKKIKEFSIKGIENKIKIEELIGGNFTITNGGIFGSLMSTPIINPPQSAILGMHLIKERPMAINGKVKILPMMYLALSYDHRLIDGKESVSFLVTIKNILEDFNRIIINV
ncbi:dihydrolipoyllysine-residue succinyltransferase [Buchnera aphidicola]|jgi:2-oxoglutarate dehydrogenase E2 component (dihydrolipoamide succinyltransferase)|uniref:Dihydrolipoyllysine-residue succinyltransferase component of 2-oxoglutarate dehydrogenase complex n=1 Tax=Buchnera aphidicola subsp. Schizaphis graminum (strain Sg) TaxID=198804 RepID=ODO2_BUCAP|nr:dihydrolipoyllysine-residue succinyltransferase [Buchnera aphidicola]Q8K9N2.1 RecName: Full=Dihydrolipoyllysine-residue succinyltransferase component of 2-oxoglutarate dehydrogenase complex; AltName: Full=2-oxoglutarate dehydrogenase complex component E2; Short=OGDC-E2; AltName: Full=Dihydrolipoamide succinyltransferase component of 2-oxoglutarate dehydrogenase complex [Buchnera aphidicola str. Sg (Schizaphis graminum)]AAM67848.1 dihydrolipoamide succinyltransferase component [Buchnera aphidic